MTIRKFENHKAAACKVYEYDNGNKVLVSYTTAVCELDHEGWLIVNGLYSMTTIKHIGWFMKELGLTYQLAKQIYNDYMKYNIYTGEFEKRG